MNEKIAKNRQRRGGYFFSLKAKEITPKSPPRHESLEASMSPKLKRLVRLYREDLQLRFSHWTVAHYSGHLRAFLAWMQEQDLELYEVQTKDLIAYQGALLALRNDEGRPYSVSFQQHRVSTLKSFFRFLVRRGYALHDPAASLDLPRADNRLPRVILTT